LSPPAPHEPQQLPAIALGLSVPLLGLLMFGAQPMPDGSTRLPVLTLLAISEFGAIANAIAAWLGVSRFLEGTFHSGRAILTLAVAPAVRGFHLDSDPFLATLICPPASRPHSRAHRQPQIGHARMYKLTTHAAIDEIPADAWNRWPATIYPLCATSFSRRWNTIGCVGERFGWIPRHLMLTDQQGRISAVAPVI
jgi:hypothetical protein